MKIILTLSFGEKRSSERHGDREADHGGCGASFPSGPRLQQLGLPVLLAASTCVLVAQHDQEAISLKHSPPR